MIKQTNTRAILIENQPGIREQNLTKRLTQCAECINRHLGLRGWLAGQSICLNVTGRPN